MFNVYVLCGIEVTIYGVWILSARFAKPITKRLSDTFGVLSCEKRQIAIYCLKWLKVSERGSMALLTFFLATSHTQKRLTEDEMESLLLELLRERHLTKQLKGFA